MENVKKVTHISTFKPEICGIASWTEDVINYSHGVDSGIMNRVIAVNGSRKLSEYGDMVDLCFDKDDKKAYRTMARILNDDSTVKVVSIQHEFGIFGGNMGDYVLEMLDELKKPTLLTTHTVLGKYSNDKKSKSRKKVFRQILPMVNHIIPISKTAQDILTNEYDVDPLKMSMILHGTHDFHESPEDSKKILGMEGFVVSTVGIVRSKRGLEYVIRAIPEAVKDFPDINYMIAGKSHPREIKEDGREPYREKLEQAVKEGGVEGNVHFRNNYLPLNSLLRFINASDVGITPYTFHGQNSSGVLSYYVGLEKPVISTPFLYAKEILGKGRGVILPDYNNPESFAKAIKDLRTHPEKIVAIKSKIKPFKEQMRWPNVARVYVEAEKQLMVNSEAE